MQTPLDQTSPSWLYLALTSLVSIIAGGGAAHYFNTWLNRRKPAAEVHRSYEEAAEITIRGRAAAAESISRLMDRLERAQNDIDRLRTDRDDWKGKARLLEFDNEQMKTEQSLDKTQIKKLKGLLDVHGIKFSEFD